MRFMSRRGGTRRPPSTSLLAGLCLAGLLAGPAAADEPARGEGARRAAQAPDDPRDALERRAARALDELRYEEAYALYEELERTGGNDLDQTRTIYRRLAEIAASMRQMERAASRYERLLALEPGFEPPPGSPDVFREVLEVARRRPGALEPLAATAEAGGPDGREIRVRIARDPLRLVAGAELYRDDRPVASARIAGGGPLRLAVSGSDRMSVQVILVDEFGNHLLGLSPIEVAALPARASQAPPAIRAPAAGRSERAWYARPSVWLGVSAAIAAGAGAALGATVPARQDQLDAILADSRSHLLGEAEAARDRLQARALQANVAFAAAGVLAAGAVIAFFLERGDEPEGASALTVTAQGGGAVVGIGGSF